MNHPFLSQADPSHEEVTCQTPDHLIRVIQNGPFLWVEADFAYSVPEMRAMLSVLEWCGWQPIPEEDYDQPELTEDGNGVRIRFYYTVTP